MSHKTFRRYGMTYAGAGVNIDAGNTLIEAIKPLAHTTHRPGASGGIGGFGGLFDLKAAGYIDPILVAASDGVGTKVKIAIETGQHETIGIDLVAMCVNDLIAQGAEPLFFLDYYATSKLDPAQGARIVQGIADGCRQAGCALLGGETAEMPGLYKKDDYDLAGFAVGAVERGHLLPMIDIMPGDVILGLPSSGLHANGFSLVRHIVEHTGLDWHAAAPFAPEKSLGTALLEPTRIYVRQLLEVIRKTGAIRGLAHITGGGMVENIPRILPPETAACIDLASVPVPPVFSWLARVGKVEEAEMLRTFNCGIGMIVIARADDITMVTNALIAAGEAPIPIGKIIASTDRPQVVTTGQLPL